MKRLSLIVLISVALIGCDNQDTQTLSASATSYKNSKGEIVVRESTKSEVETLDKRLEKLQEIDNKYPAPDTPLQKNTYVVRSITEDGVFILENDLHLSLSGINCDASGVHFIRKFFVEDTERLAYQSDGNKTEGIIEAYAWLVDTSMMNDPEMKQYGIGPSFAGVNDMVIMNNWCEIDLDSSSKHIARYQELEKISRKNKR
jgi:hypothetical protein